MTNLDLTFVSLTTLCVRSGQPYRIARWEQKLLPFVSKEWYPPSTVMPIIEDAKFIGILCMLKELGLKISRSEKERSAIQTNWHQSLVCQRHITGINILTNIFISTTLTSTRLLVSCTYSRWWRGDTVIFRKFHISELPTGPRTDQDRCTTTRCPFDQVGTLFQRL